MGPPSPEPREPRQALTWGKGMIGILAGLVGAIVLGLVVAIPFAVAGVEHLADNHAYQFAATFAGELALIAAALMVTAGATRPTPALFGFRRFPPSALGWAFVTLIAFFALAVAYGAIVSPKPDDLTKELGADQSTFYAVLTAVFTIGVAPSVEEFFFRGFLYQALRNSWGIPIAAAASGLSFGLVHFKPEFLVPLTMLGVFNALLFEKTKSLWPSIMVHASWNALVIAVTL